MAFQDQQQLRPLGKMAGLVAPGPEDVGLVVPVVIPVHGPVRLVVFPHQVAGQCRLPHRDVVRKRFRPLQVANLAGRIKCRKHGLARMHVRILSPVGGKRRPVCTGFVGIERVICGPEASFHQVECLADPRTRFFDAGHQGMRISQEDEGEPVAMVGAVRHLAAIQNPGIAAGGGIAMPGAQEKQAVLHGAEVIRVAELPPRHRIVEDEARAAHQVSRMGVVDRTIVAPEMKEAAVRIDGARMVERHGVADVIEEERAAAEIRHGRPHIVFSSPVTAGRRGGTAPDCRQAAVPVATANFRCASQSASGQVMRL